jgi:hypothetical protein
MTKINWNKMYWVEFDKKQMPRKVKKMFLGRRMAKSKLKKLLASVVITPATNGHDSAMISPYPFCPKCGCCQTTHNGSMVEYPERYVKDYCLRCGFLVVLSDNSPYYHALENKEFNYELV